MTSALHSIEHSPSFFRKVNMTILTKQQASELLHISQSTLERRVKAGRYQCQPKQSDHPCERMTFSYADIGLVEPVPEPTPTPEPTVVEAPQPEPEPEPSFTPRPLSGFEKKQADDAQFARDYLAGRATDSAGNNSTVGIETCSLLGPHDPEPSGPSETQSHMNQALLGTNDSAGNPVEAPRHAFENGEGHTRQGSPLCAGYSQQAYDAAMRDWTRRGGRRSEGEQEIASRDAIQNINRSFPTAPHSSRPTVR